MPQLSKLFVFLIAAVLLSGCKIVTIVVEGGSVGHPRSPCYVGNICTFEVTDAEFNYVFSAFPRKGWIFDRWLAGDHFLCGNRKQRTCFVSLRDLEDETAEKIVASSESAYLMPVFRRSLDIIEVNGKEWFQPSLFVGLSWHEISAICPDGICTGTLKDQDMTGWTWASVKDMNDLFNYYIGSELLGPGPDREEGSFDQIESNMFWDGWEPLYLVFTGYDAFIVRGINGWTRDGLNTNTDNAWSSMWLENSPELPNVPPPWDIYASTNRNLPKSASRDQEAAGEDIGAWFYRLP